MGMGLSSRRSPRVLVGAGTEATITFSKTSLRCKLLQVSAGGVLLGVDANMVLPPRFEVSFRLPGSIMFEVMVETRHRLPRGGFRLDLEQPTLGCSFMMQTSDTRQAVSTFVEQQRQTLKQLQFGLALVPPSPKVTEYATKVGVPRSVEMPVPQLQQFVTWSIAQLST